MKNGKVILVIDDEIGYRQLYQYLLEPLGYEVETAEDGSIGCEMALKKYYEMIFLDVHMPKMLGPEVLKRIKEQHPEQIIIIFSSDSDSNRQFEEESMKLGAFDCLYKPVDLKDIVNVIERVNNYKSNGK